MEKIDLILTGVSAICTFLSGFGAYKSVRYFRKSKQLTIYAKTNVAYTEIQTIKSTMIELLKLSNKKQGRGTNLSQQIGKNGELIKRCIENIRDHLPVEKCAEIQELLDHEKTKVEEYIDSFITGNVLIEEKLMIDDDFNNCQQVFGQIQTSLKKYLEELAETLK
ncbi:MAG: hypothetical protein JEZ08_16650 [Clostridiales bacterium]|nr:hypothetical protein [Clostridiales bacterium]